MIIWQLGVKQLQCCQTWWVSFDGQYEEGQCRDRGLVESGKSLNEALEALHWWQDCKGNYDCMAETLLGDWQGVCLHCLQMH